jgi:hypothetical protein
VRESELIGLMPLRAFTDVADHAGVPADLAVDERLRSAAEWLRLRDFDPTMALELRMDAARAAAGGAVGGREGDAAGGARPATGR